MDLKFTEVEVMKLNPQPDETLMFKLKIDGITSDDIEMFGRQTREKFPNNKVVVLGMQPGEDVELTIIKESAKVDCSDPVQYCSDCHCGKKERIEGV